MRRNGFLTAALVALHAFAATAVTADAVAARAPEACPNPSVTRIAVERTISGRQATAEASRVVATVENLGRLAFEAPSGAQLHLSERGPRLGLVIDDQGARVEGVKGAADSFAEVIGETIASRRDKRSEESAS